MKNWLLAQIAALLLASCAILPDPAAASRYDIGDLPASAKARGDADSSSTVLNRFVEGRPLRAPTGYLVFCQESPDDCRSAANGTARWNRSTELTVQSINASVNRSIKPANEPFEQWSARVLQGDCEDYALTKRRVLIRAGLPVASLRMAVATTATGEMHAVLVVRTSRGDFVLDNRNDDVLKPRETALRWTKMASAEDPRIWHTIQAGTIAGS